MKALILVPLLSLTGCMSEITPNVFDWAVALCRNNGGIKNLTSFEYEPTDKDYNYVECVNGAQFQRNK